MGDRSILASNLRQMASWCKSGEDDDGSGTFIPAYPSGDVYDILMQAARELAATHPQPVTPAGGEVEPSLWVADALVDSCRLLGDAATVHRVMVATKPQAQYTTPLYLHPPVADAALVAAAKKVSALYPLHWDRDDGAAIVMPERVPQMEEAFAELDAALNQRGGA